MKRKIDAAAVATLALAIVCNVYSSEPQKKAENSSAPTVAVKSGLSPAFKKQAWRALDAISRIDTARDESLIREADKAWDEAKYEASTPLDKHVLHVLLMAFIYRKQQAALSGDPKAVTALEHYWQCSIEAELYINPSSLSEAGKADARRGICGKDYKEQ